MFLRRLKVLRGHPWAFIFRKKLPTTSFSGPIVDTVRSGPFVLAITLCPMYIYQIYHITRTIFHATIDQWLVSLEFWTECTLLLPWGRSFYIVFPVVCCEVGLRLPALPHPASVRVPDHHTHQLQYEKKCRNQLWNFVNLPNYGRMPEFRTYDLISDVCYNFGRMP